MAGGVDRLVGLLGADAGKARAAAALALYHHSMASEAFCAEAFSSACNAVLLQRGEAAVLAAPQRLYAGEPPERAAAAHLLHVRACPAQLPSNSWCPWTHTCCVRGKRCFVPGRALP